MAAIGGMRIVPGLPLVFLAAVTLSLSCSSSPPAGTPTATKLYTATAVWDVLAGTPPPSLVLKLLDCREPQRGQDFADCVVQVMSGEGATSAAIAFFMETGGILVRFREMGIVDLGSVALIGANASPDQYLMNGQPALVSLEAEGLKLSLASDPDYQRLFDAVSSAGIRPSPVELRIYYDDNYYEATIASARGETRFVFQYPVVNNCRSCSFGYNARVGLDFDSNAKYLGATLIGLCRIANAEVELSGIPPCPATSP